MIPEIDIPALFILILSAILCSSIGCILLVQRRAMIGDSLSHAVLPGLVVSYLVTHSLNPLWMLLGALVSGLLSMTMTQFMHRYLKLDSGVSMGITLTTFFAFGVFLLEIGAGGDVHLDTHHALYGALELSYWPDLSLKAIPFEIIVAGVAIIIFAAIGTLVFRNLQMTIFDKDFAIMAGVKTQGLDALVLIFASVAIVLSFKALGAILVISLLTCPAAAVSLHVKTLSSLVFGAVILAVVLSILSYCAASFLPLWLGFSHSVHVGGVTACICGAAVLFSIRGASRLL